MGRAIVLSTSRIIVLIGTALVVGYLIGISSSGQVIGRNSSKDASEVFVLMVNLQFTSIERRDTFLELIEPVCVDVLYNEGPSKKATIIKKNGIAKPERIITTLSYKVAISDDDPLKVLILERYADKDNAYMDIHRSGKEFLKFRNQLKVMQEADDVMIDGHSYIETDLGYV